MYCYFIILCYFIIFIVSFLFCLCMCVGAWALFLFCKLQKSIKTFSNILKLPGLCFRFSCSSFLPLFWQEMGFRFWLKVFDLIYTDFAILGLFSYHLQLIQLQYYKLYLICVEKNMILFHFISFHYQQYLSTISSPKQVFFYLTS